MVLETAYDARLPEALRLDGTRLRQVLLNLVSNACRHSGGHRIVLSAGEGAARLPELVHLEITVSDDGAGIPVADRERIFRPFEQVGTSDAGKGLGLGLAICRQLMNLMGGEITLVPDGQGTSFRLQLDAEPIDLPAQAGLPRPPARQRYAGRLRHILVVDDAPEGQDVLAQMVSRLGFAVEQAASGEAALARLASGGIDLVLSDRRMPGMNGLQLLQEARRQGHSLPFILVSASSTEEEAAGFAAVLAKPLDSASLATTVGRVLGLAWQQDVAEQAASAAPLPPSAAKLAQLRRAAEEGRISDMEDWVQQVLQTEPQAREFALQVRQALRRLDLAAILAMTA